MSFNINLFRNAGLGNRLDGAYPLGDGVSGGLQFTPTYLIDAESATLGQTYSGTASDQWTDASGETTAQNTNVLYGDKAWRLFKAAATASDGGGFGQWGGRKTLDVNVERYGKIHTQWSVFLPTDFNWDANPFLKFFRFLVASGGGSPLGHIDMYIHSLDHGMGPDTSGQLAYHSEVEDTFSHIDGEIMQKNVWETFEMEVTLDTVPVDLGGQARTRIWRNKSGVMTLIADITSDITMQSTTDVINSILLFTYWNSGAEDGTYPATDQVCYADRIVIETDPDNKLVETDAGGNKIIGGLL